MGLLNINSGAKGNPLDALLNGRNIWGSSNGMLYQYGRDSQGRDTFGPGTDEAGNPLGNQDGSMIGSQDQRYGAAQQALSQYGPGWTQVRTTDIGGPGGVRDPSQVKYDPTLGLVTQASNLNPMADDTTRNMMIVLAPALAGMALGAASGAGMGAGYGDSIGALTGGSATAGAGAGGLPDSYWGMTADSGQLGTDAAVDEAGQFAGLDSGVGNPYGPGAFDSTGFSGTGLMDVPVSDLSVQAEQSANPAAVEDHSFNSRLLNPNGLLNTLSTPQGFLRTAGLAQAAYGLLSGHKGVPTSGSSSGSKGGTNSNGSGGSFNAPQQQFYVNPYIQAQIQRGYGR